MADVFQKIDDEAFKTDNRIKGWMMKCVHFFIEYYGIAPIEVIYKMYKQKIKCTLDEMVEMLKEMPRDIIESCIFTMNKIGIKDCPVDSPLYSKNGLFVHILLFDHSELGYLLNPNGLNGQVVNAEKKIYPNDLCPCGSGKKYKKCCGKFKQV